MPANSDHNDLPLSSQERMSAKPIFAPRSGSGGEVSVAVSLPAGVALHARPAADLVRAASRLPTQVTIGANGRVANARSILEVLALGATGGTELTLSATGPGAPQAVSALAEVVASLGG